MKIYLSGGITGIPLKNEPAFTAGALALREMGHEVINPLELDFADNDALDWYQCLRRDLAYLVTCDALVLLPGWEKSRGARLEVTVAKALDMPLYINKDNVLCLEYVSVDVTITPLVDFVAWK